MFLCVFFVYFHYLCLHKPMLFLMTHTRNLCSAFNPSKCTHTAVSSEQAHAQTHTHTHTHAHTCTRMHTHTHTHMHTRAHTCTRMHTHTHTHTHSLTHSLTRSSGQPFMLWRLGSSWGFGALKKYVQNYFFSVISLWCQ